MNCLYCNQPCEDRYPAFHWGSYGAYRLLDPTGNPFLNPIHKTCYRAWYERHIAGLAELDEVMDYCRFFERTSGNEGFYVRDGKKFPVKGDWNGIQDFNYHHSHTGCGCLFQGFMDFLRESGWERSWFELRPKYQAILSA